MYDNMEWSQETKALVETLILAIENTQKQLEAVHGGALVLRNIANGVLPAAYWAEIEEILGAN